jgi:ATP-binding cassette subfamily B protein
MIGRYAREGAEGKPKGSPVKIMARLLRLVWKYKARVIIFVAAATAVLGLNVIAPYIGKRIVDEGIVAKDINALTYYSIIFTAVAVCIWALSTIRGYSIAWLTQRLLYDLRSELFAQDRKSLLLLHIRRPGNFKVHQRR